MSTKMPLASALLASDAVPWIVWVPMLYGYTGIDWNVVRRDVTRSLEDEDYVPGDKSLPSGTFHPTA